MLNIISEKWIKTIMKGISWLFSGYSILNIHWKDWCWSWSSNTLATWCEEQTHWKRPWCWERLRAGGKGDDRGWDGWTASLTQWRRVWANSRRWWTGKAGMLQSMELQRVGHDWEIKQQPPVVKTWHFHCSGPSLILGHGTKIPQASRFTPHLKKPQWDTSLYPLRWQ